MAEPSPHGVSRPCVLVVDDEPELGRALLDMLADEPLCCVWVDSAPDALERLAFGNYDLVLTDLLMPKVGGLELLRAIEELDPELPVVLVTDEGEPEAAVEAVRARAFDFLWKPVDPVKLLEAVRRGLATRHRAVRERELAAAERRRLERRSLLLSILFEQGSDCVLTWDANGRLVDLSPGIVALTGIELEHVLAAGSTELFEREPFGGVIEDRIRELARKPGRLQSQEVVVRTREGPTPARLTLMVCELPPAEDGEQPVCWIVGLLQPPDREGLRDRLRRADRLTGAAMVSSVAAHEIKNDLGPLLTCMSLLEDANVDDEIGEVLIAASECVRRIGAGVERILAPLRPQRAHPRHLEIGELVRDSVSFVRRSGVGPRPRIVLEVAEQLSGILARPEDIHQIVVNLVANAFEALAADRADPSATICVRVFDDPEAERIVLEVQDDGPGIDPSAQTRVFEPFFTTKGARGTGLGLPVVRDLVRGLGGDLTIVSVPVIAGTCVRVGLPRA